MRPQLGDFFLMLVRSKIMEAFFQKISGPKKPEKKQKGKKIWLFEKLINQLQVRIQAEPMGGKYSGGNSASF